MTETINPDSICTSHDPWVRMVWTGQPFGWWCPECKAYVVYLRPPSENALRTDKEVNE